MNPDMLIFGGIINSKYTWSIAISPSIISTPFQRHYSRIVSMISRLCDS